MCVHASRLKGPNHGSDWSHEFVRELDGHMDSFVNWSEDIASNSQLAHAYVENHSHITTSIKPPSMWRGTTNKSAVSSRAFKGASFP